MAAEPIHICHILYRFATGGLENGVVNLINKLPHDEFKHSIICVSDSDPEFVKRLQRNDVDIYHLNKKPGRSIGYLFKLRKIVNQLSPHIVHSRNLSAIESQIACVGYRGVSIHGEHGWDGPQAKFNKNSQLLRKIAKVFIDQYVVLSNESHQYLTGQIGVNSKLINHIYNGVDLDKFDRNGSALNDGVFKIISVGRLAEVKNFSLLIRAIATLVLVENLTNISLSIVGDGPRYQELSDLIESLNLQAYCKLLGNRDDIPKLLKDSDLFVLSSTAEGISNTILEAMACSLAVVATDVGGNKELVKECQCGALFDSENEAQLVSHLQYYLTHREQCKLQGKNARKRVEKLFSIDQMINQYATLYRNAMNK